MTTKDITLNPLNLSEKIQSLNIMIGFGLYSIFQNHELLYIVFSIWAFQSIASTIRLKYYQFGHLEWIWRNLNYQKRHPLRKGTILKLLWM